MESPSHLKISKCTFENIKTEGDVTVSAIMNKGIVEMFGSTFSQNQSPVRLLLDFTKISHVIIIDSPFSLTISLLLIKGKCDLFGKWKSIEYASQHFH